MIVLLGNGVRGILAGSADTYVLFGTFSHIRIVYDCARSPRPKLFCVFCFTTDSTSYLGL